MTESVMPAGWAVATLEELAGLNGLVTDGDWVESKDQDPNGSVRLVQLADIGDGFFADRSNRFMNRQTADRLNCTQLQSNDLLIARMPEPLGRACLLPDTRQAAVTVVDVLVWRPDSVQASADPRWLMHAINSPTMRKKIYELSGGSTRTRISGGKLKRLDLPVPPLAEQRRIADKTDQLLGFTGRARVELARLPLLIASYKSAVLRRAFAGELTADLRPQPTSAGGLPDGWRLCPLGTISDIQSGIQVGKKRADQGGLVEIPYLRVANVQRGWLALDEIRTIRVTPAEKERLLLRKGDILMNEGGDRDKLGRGWVWGEELPECIHQNHVFRVRLQPGILPPEYVSHFANEHGQRYFFDEGTQTTNLASISKSKVAALPIPVPPLLEAVEIVRRVAAALAWLDNVQVNQARAAALLSQLDASVLTKALAGDLVAQKADEEPASVRLNAIREGQSGRRMAGRGKPARATSLREMADAVEKTLEEVLAEAGDWISAQTAFSLWGSRANATTEEVESFYAQLRELEFVGRLEVKSVKDSQGRKVEDQLRLKVV